jgi:hypothetical protein
MLKAASTQFTLFKIAYQTSRSWRTTEIPPRPRLHRSFIIALYDMLMKKRLHASSNGHEEEDTCYNIDK